MFLQISYIKHIEQDFCSDAWVMPQGWDLGAPSVPMAVKKLFSNIVMYHIYLTGMMRGTENKYNFLPRVKLVTLR